ncbi:hypothetical protein [uncultured Pseudomonas sp.]|uniref:hypothetical protein n=1 Tax=uncultured Pseudomonas sp. TaxID=114707 RepID=UPI0020575AE2|nr:hypothetical protein [uncultured Pseudomonas sp.]DAK19349.1 MAG TPA: hypothetical protein [Caudoviricetes sp.]
MKTLLTIGSALALSVSSTVFAQNYPVKTLQANAIICFDRTDWEEMIAASVDQDTVAASRLVSSGACRVVSKPTWVLYLDKAGNSGSLIQMPSGKGAYTSDSFVK